MEFLALFSCTLILLLGIAGLFIVRHRRISGASPDSCRNGHHCSCGQAAAEGFCERRNPGQDREDCSAPDSLK